MNSSAETPTIEVPPHADVARLRIGLVVLLLSTVAFGLNNILARLSYDNGSNVLTLLTVRTVIGLVVIGAYLSWLNLWRRFARSDLPVFALAAVSFSTGTFLLLESFHYLPVSLAILLFYLFPITVALINLATGEERLTPYGWVGVVTAFCGLALALEIFHGFELNLVGVALSTISALFMALSIVSTHRLMQRFPGIFVTFWMLAASGIFFAVAMFAIVGIAWPDAGRGVLVFSGAVISGPIALVTFFVGLSMVGSSKTALVMNAEPLTTILFAAAILGEALGWLQYGGAAIVIASIVLVTLAERKRNGG